MSELDIDGLPTLSPEAEEACQSALGHILEGNHAAADADLRFSESTLTESYDDSEHDSLAYIMQRARIAHVVGFAGISKVVQQLKFADLSEVTDMLRHVF